MRISDWSSDVCSSDLQFAVRLEQPDDPAADDADPRERDAQRRPGGGRGGIGGHAGLHEATEPRPVIASALSAFPRETRQLFCFRDAERSGISYTGGLRVRVPRPEERREGHEGARRCRTWWFAYH